MKVAEVAQRIWLSYAEMATLTALGTANRRLLRKQNRSVRSHDNGLRALDTLLWHTVLPPAPDVEELLAGALDLFTSTAATAGSCGAAQCVYQAVHDYLHQLLTERVPHDHDELAKVLEAAGCWDEQPPAQRRPLQ